MEYREISDSKITCGGTLFLSGLGFFMSYLLHFLPFIIWVKFLLTINDKFNCMGRN